MTGEDLQGRVPLTVEQARIAEAIDAEIERLVKQGKSQATILGAMQDYMPGFKQLLDAGVVQTAADRYPGFRRFAKILERTARAIASGAIAVPGGRAKARQRGDGPRARPARGQPAVQRREAPMEDVQGSADARGSGA